ALGSAGNNGVGTMTFSSDGRRLFLVESTGVLQFTLPENSGIAASLSVDGISKFLPAGGTTSFTVSAKDPAGNIAAGYRGTVHFTVPTDSGANVPLDYTFTDADAGVHTFSMTLTTLGVHTLNVVDTANSLSRPVAGIQVYAPSPATLIP